MKKLITIIIISMCLIVPVLAQQLEYYPQDIQERVRFAPVHIYIDSGSKALAAFQFELKAATGQIKIVGVEGGQHPAFAEPAYYDPAALMNNRIIIADFNTGSDLPKGRTRIATLHLQIIGDAEPEYELELAVAAEANGNEIPVEITFEKGQEK